MVQSKRESLRNVRRLGTGGAIALKLKSFGIHNSRRGQPAVMGVASLRSTLQSGLIMTGGDVAASWCLIMGLGGRE